MIAIPGNVRVWLATGHTDMRRGFPSLARLVQESLNRDPHIGDLYVFRGRRGDLIKIIWHDGQGACLFTKRLERGRFLWPSLADGVVTISVAQLPQAKGFWRVSPHSRSTSPQPSRSFGILPCPNHSMRRVAIQSIRDVVIGSIAL